MIEKKNYHVPVTNTSNYFHSLVPRRSRSRRRTSGRLSYISCHRGMASVGVIEALIVLRKQYQRKLNVKINAPFPFCTICRATLPSSTQRRPLTPETSAASRRVVDFFVIPVLPETVVYRS